MNPKTGTQIIAAFMIISMVLSSVLYFIGDDGSNNGNIQSINTVTEEYFNVGGEQVFHNFNSITDGLQMSTPNVTSATFVDVDYIEYTAFQPWHEQLSGNITTVKQLMSSEIDGLYSTKTLQMYFAQLPDDEIILLSTMSPKTVVFDYIGLPSNNDQYLLLIRSDVGGTNVMGEPTIYVKSRETAEAVLAIVESWAVPATAYDTFVTVLNQTDGYDEYQVVNSEVEFADLYYMGMRRNDDGTFTRTTVYYNPTEHTLSHIQELADIGLDRGFSQYEFTQDGNILKVVISGQFAQVANENIS